MEGQGGGGEESTGDERKIYNRGKKYLRIAPEHQRGKRGK